MDNITKVETGDLVEVILKGENHVKFKGIVVENYEGAFVTKVLQKQEGMGTSTWKRYGLEKDGRFSTYNDCESIRIIAKPEVTTASGTLTLNESIAKNSNLTYYKTILEDGKVATLCICDDYGGWSFQDKDDESLKEAFLESYINSKIIE